MHTTAILLAIVAIADSYHNNCNTVGLNLISADSCNNNRKNINSVLVKYLTYTRTVAKGKFYCRDFNFHILEMCSFACAGFGRGLVILHKTCRLKPSITDLLYVSQS